MIDPISYIRQIVYRFDVSNFFIRSQNIIDMFTNYFLILNQLYYIDINNLIFLGGLSSLPEISDKMATAYLVICIRHIRNGF